MSTITATPTSVAPRKTFCPPGIDRLEWELERELCLRSLAHFVRRFWPVVTPGIPIIWSWHLQAICDHLQAIDEGVYNKLIICIPPGFGKSTLVSVLWPAWSWLHRPWLRSLYGSYDEKLTYRDSILCRDVIKSKLYQDLFNPRWQLRSDISSMGYFANTMQGARKTYYVGSSHKTGWRANYVIVDDPLSAEDRNDANKKRDVQDTWDKVLSTRANRSQHHAFIVIMQRLSDDDLAGYLIEKYGDEYVQLILPVEYDPATRCETPIFRDPRTEPGQLLCPEFFPRKAVEEVKQSLGIVDYTAQYLHRPYPIGGNLFKLSDFQYWSETEVSLIIKLISRNGVEKLVNLIRIEKFLSVDLAASDKKTNDYTAIGLWGITQQSELILLHFERFKLSAPEVIERIKGVYTAPLFGLLAPISVDIEQNGLGLPIAQHVQNEGMAVNFINVHKEKTVMSGSLLTRMRGGQVYYPTPEIRPDMHELIREFQSFPAGANDDYVSMASIASNSLFERRRDSLGTPSTIPHNKPRYDANKVQADLSKGMLSGVKSGMNGDVVMNRRST